MVAKFLDHNNRERLSDDHDDDEDGNKNGENAISLDRHLILACSYR